MNKITNFQQHILVWYKKNKRKLPWRETTNPYHILVSEIMLQQTQVDRVIPKYNNFIKRFPNLKTLAKANTEELLQAWQGLGYNSRVLRLQQVAKILRDKPFPTTQEELIKLPGIGPYTSRSILIFAFNQDMATIDTNIRRILIHEKFAKEHFKDKELQYVADKLLPKGFSRDWHNALMDYGSLILTSKKTGIKPTSKQPKFKESDRYYRGQIIKLLLKEKEIKIKDLERTLNKPLQNILKKLEKEKVIRIKNSVVFF